jgi:hypothetical protein
MTGLKIEVDSAQFARALDDYQRATRKPMSYVINRSMNNWAIQSQDFIKVAMESKIRSLQSLPWWPKLIAKILTRAPRMTAGMGAKRWGQLFRRRARQLQGKQRYYTVEQAKRRSSREIRRRVNARQFLKGFFLKWSNAIAATVPGIKGPRGVSAHGGFYRSLQARYTRRGPARALPRYRRCLTGRNVSDW